MAKKKKDIRPVIRLLCSECKGNFYSTTKNTRNTPDRLGIKKYCKTCRKQTLHKETK